MRRLCFRFLFAAMVLPLVSCVAQTEIRERNEGTSKSSDPEERSSTDLMASLPPLPIEQYVASHEGRMLMAKAEEVLIEECMGRFGISYTATLEDDHEVSESESRRYGVADIATVERHGFHVALGADGSADDRPMSAEEELVLFGLSTEEEGSRDASYEGIKIPQGGCYAESKSALRNIPVPVQDIEAVQGIDSQSFTASMEDARVVEALESWSQCMERDGFFYESPLESIGDPEFLGESISDHEIKVATGDVLCKKETDLISIWRDVEIEIQDSLISEHSDSISRIQQYHEDQLSEARRVIERD